MTCLSKVRVLAATALTALFALASHAVEVPAQTGNECAATWRTGNAEATPGRNRRKPWTLTCTDGDPSCDLDGQVNSRCAVQLIACTGQGGPACTPQRLVGFKLGGKTRRFDGLGAPDVTVASCGSPGVASLRLRGKAGKRPKRSRKVTVSMQFKTMPGGTGRNTLVVRCVPNPVGIDPLPPPWEPCPATCPNDPGIAPAPRQLCLQVPLPDATTGSNGSDLDIGWNGVAHDFPVVGGASLRYCLSNCDGVHDTLCDASGDTGPGTLNGETFGAPLPLLSATVPVCLVNRYQPGPITGEFDLASGAGGEGASGPNPVDLFSDTYLRLSTPGEDLPALRGSERQRRERAGSDRRLLADGPQRGGRLRGGWLRAGRRWRGRSRLHLVEHVSAAWGCPESRSRHRVAPALDDRPRGERAGAEPVPGPGAARPLRRRHVQRGVHRLRRVWAERRVHRPEGRHRPAVLLERLRDVVLPHQGRWHHRAAGHPRNRPRAVRLDLLYRAHSEVAVVDRPRRVAGSGRPAPPGRSDHSAPPHPLSGAAMAALSLEVVKRRATDYAGVVMGPGDRTAPRRARPRRIAGVLGLLLVLRALTACERGATIRDLDGDGMIRVACRRRLEHRRDVARRRSLTLVRARRAAERALERGVRWPPLAFLNVARGGATVTDPGIDWPWAGVQRDQARSWHADLAIAAFGTNDLRVLHRDPAAVVEGYRDFVRDFDSDSRADRVHASVRRRVGTAVARRGRAEPPPARGLPARAADRLPHRRRPGGAGRRRAPPRRGPGGARRSGGRGAANADGGRVRPLRRYCTYPSASSARRRSGSSADRCTPELALLDVAAAAELCDRVGAATSQRGLRERRDRGAPSDPSRPSKSAAPASVTIQVCVPSRSDVWRGPHSCSLKTWRSTGSAALRAAAAPGSIPGEPRRRARRPPSPGWSAPRPPAKRSPARGGPRPTGGCWTIRGTCSCSV